MIDFIKKRLRDSARTKLELLELQDTIQTLQKIIDLSIDRFKKGHKMLVCGNGGSAADAQHIAAELSGRFYKDRKPLFAEALHVNTSYLTAVANDYSYDEIFSRATEAMGRKGDILFGLSTSGNSRNIIKALEKARSLEMATIGFTGQEGGEMTPLCDYLIKVPSKDTPRIQEAHITLGHILCEAIEEGVFDSIMD